MCIQSEYFIFIKEYFRINQINKTKIQFNRRTEYKWHKYSNSSKKQ